MSSPPRMNSSTTIPTQQELPISRNEQLSREALLQVQELVYSSSEIRARLRHNGFDINHKKKFKRSDDETVESSLHEILGEIKVVAKNLASIKNSILLLADWGNNMPKEVLTKIVEHVEHYEDFETLRWVCSSWRRAAKEANFRACVAKSSLCGDHTLPWLLLPKKSSHYNKSKNSCRLYSLSTHMVRHIALPDSLNDQNYDNFRSRLLSSHGWLLLVLETRKLTLYNPFSGSIIEPPMYEYLHPTPYLLDKFVLSANPSTTSDFVVFLSLETRAAAIHPFPSVLVFWRNGTDGWIEVNQPPIAAPLLPWMGIDFLLTACRDITFYQGEFYGVNFEGKIVKFQTAQGNPYFQDVANLSTRDADEKYYYYLVESLGHLFVIQQVVDELAIYGWRRTKRFEVLELNVYSGEVKKVHNLGNRAIFVGSNSSFSVEVSSLDRGFKPNCVYNTDDRVTWRWTFCGYGFRDTCFYNLKDGEIGEFYHGPSLLVGEFTPFMWVESPIPSNFL